jgi:hypothetical protein
MYRADSHTVLATNQQLNVFVCLKNRAPLFLRTTILSFDITATFSLFTVSAKSYPFQIFLTIFSISYTQHEEYLVMVFLECFIYMNGPNDEAITVFECLLTSTRCQMDPVKTIL